jgi:alpha-tubulin suppressor-like RCC1 family protein
VIVLPSAAALACSSFTADAPPATIEGGLDGAPPADAEALGDGGPGDAAACAVTSLAVAHSGAHACAVKSGGTVWCWGANDSRQLGDANGPSQPAVSGTPLQVPDITDAVAVVAGGAHSCALKKTGTLVCWGANDHGQLGVGTVNNEPLPPTTVVGLVNVTSVTAGTAHTCALTASGIVSCWGLNDVGQLGLGSASAAVSSPTPVLLDGPASAASAVTAGGRHTCALGTDGSLQCWGSNFFGQVGVGFDDAGQAGTNHLLPQMVRSARVTEVSAGYVHTCAVVEGSGVSCWGFNYFGTLGDHSTGNKGLPGGTTVAPGGATLSGISSGRFHTCALDGTSGSPYCWGDNHAGEVHASTTSVSIDPVLITNPFPALSIHAGFDMTCARVKEGPPLCWGSNQHGELGRGNAEAVVGDAQPTANPEPAPVIGLCP